MKPTFSIFSLLLILTTTSAQNIGINIANPAYPLTVGADVSNKGIAQKTGLVEVGFFTSTNSAYLQTWSNHPLLFSTNNSGPQMILTTGGNLGIGTTTPTAKLDVDGSLRIRGGIPLMGRVLIAADGNGNAAWQPAPSKILNQYIAHSSFFPANSYAGYTTVGNIGRRPNNLINGASRFIAPLQLPVGSRIKEMVWFFNDMSNSQDLGFSIFRRDKGGSVSGFYHCYSSGSSGDQVIRSVSYTGNLEIDEHEIYWLTVEVDNWPIDNSMFISGVKITYEIPL